MNTTQHSQTETPFSADLTDTDAPEESSETDVPMSEDELREQYQQLPLWQHVLLVILFLFGMTAVIMIIDFVVDFGAELLRRLF